MAKTKSDTIQQKAKEMRQKQERAEKRTRAAIATVVSALVLAITVSITLIATSGSRQKGIKEHPSQESLPSQFQEGEPIAISSEGVGVSNPEVEDLYFYFDYTCPGCVSLDAEIGPILTEASQAGDFNFLLQPVVTAGGPFNVAATAGAVMVAAEEPESFIRFHEALINFYTNVLQSLNDSGVADPKTAMDTVSEIALQTGVSEDVVSEFSLELGQQYLDKATQNWLGREIKGQDSYSTPELVYKDTRLEVTGKDSVTILESIRNEILALDN